MEALLQQFSNLPMPYLQNLFLTFVRVGAILLTAPIFSSRAIPSVAKVALALFLSLILLPISTPGLDLVFDGVGTVLLAVAREVLVGVIVGFVASLMFMAIQTAGHVIGLQMGFAFANVIDPMNQNQISLVDQFYNILAILFFLAINGHHLLLMAMQKSFDIVPLDTFVFSDSMATKMITLTGQVLLIAAKIALPMMAALILADVALAIMARIAPQLQVFFLGMPLKIALGLLTIALALPITLNAIAGLTQNAPSDVLSLLRVAH